MDTFKHTSKLLIALAAYFTLVGSSLTNAIGIGDIVDGGNTFPWQRVELPGTQCSNGSQYKFFVHDSPTSNNLLVLFEGGGACWDYASCSGSLGTLGAANPNGIPNNYITSIKGKYVSPLVNGADPGMPFRKKIPIVTNGWDVVYLPYCTGDVHTGNNVVTYSDPAGVNPPILFHHKGYNNTVQAMNFLAGKFPSINKLFVSGFSAGGVASGSNYYVVRKTLKPQRGYMLNDSGPLYLAPNTSFHSRYLHETIKTAWNLSTVLSLLPPSFDQNDFGSTSRFLSTEFPNDQLAYTAYTGDYIYSRFSYERFYPGIDKAGVLEKWRQDQAILVTEMDKLPNFSYIIPWHRPINESHTSTILTFIGSHSCPSMRKKLWYEAIQPPWSQTWKCPGEMLHMHSFLDRWINKGEKIRSIESYNNYNNEDIGMRIIAPLINYVL